MEIRLLAQQELAHALQLIWEVFLAYEAPDYSPEGVASFQEYIEQDAMLRRLEGRQITFWGSFRENRLVGCLAAVPPGHIALFFVRPEYHRQGIGKALFHTFLQSFGESAPEISVHSSPYAVKIYERLGFVATGPEQVADGIRFTPMAYPSGERS